MDGKTVLAIVLALLLAGSVFLFATQQSHLYFFELTNVLPMVFSGMAFAFLALNYSAKRNWLPELRFAWCCLALGVGIWFLAETAYGALALMHGTEMELSPADALWFLGYLPIIYGIRGVRRSLFPGERTSPLLFALFALLGIGIAYSILMPIAQGESDSLLKLVMVAYPVGDFVILFYAVDMLVTLYRKLYSMGRTALALGFVFITASDIWYALAVSKGAYFTGHPSDLLSYFGYAFIAYAAYLTRESK